MKKCTIFLCFMSVMLFCTSCNAGRTNNAVIDLGESARFSKEEIQAAADCVLKEFPTLSGCDLLELWYDEKYSNDECGIDTANEICLRSIFHTDASIGGGFNPDHDYWWVWHLARNSKTENWVVTSYGHP